MAKFINHVGTPPEGMSSVEKVRWKEGQHRGNLEKVLRELGHPNGNKRITVADMYEAATQMGMCVTVPSRVLIWAEEEAFFFFRKLLNIGWSFPRN